MSNRTKQAPVRKWAFVFAILLSGLVRAPESQAAVMPQLTRLPALTRNIVMPTAVAVDPQGRVYVVESTSNRMLASAPSGACPKVYAGFSAPVSVAAAAGGRVLVGSKKKGAVDIFDVALDSVVGQLGKGSNEFLSPTGIAAAEDGTIYVADMKADRVKVYSADGTFIRTLIEPGDAAGLTSSPVAIAVDNSANEIAVVDQPTISSETGGDYAGARVQIFDREGGFVAAFSGYGVGNDLLTSPIGVAVDASGRIYVSDSYQNHVKIFSRQGERLGVIRPETDPLRTPLGLAYSAESNRLFITSLRSRRVEVYGIDDYAADHGEFAIEGCVEENTTATAYSEETTQPPVSTTNESSADVQQSAQQSNEAAADSEPGQAAAGDETVNEQQTTQGAAAETDETAPGGQDGGASSEANTEETAGYETTGDAVVSADQSAGDKSVGNPDGDVQAEAKADGGAATGGGPGGAQCFIRALWR